MSTNPAARSAAGRLIRSYIHWCVSPRRRASPRSLRSIFTAHSRLRARPACLAPHHLFDHRGDVFVVCARVVIPLKVREILLAQDLEIRNHDAMDSARFQDAEHVIEKRARPVAVDVLEEMGVIYDVRGAIAGRDALAEVVHDDIRRQRTKPFAALSGQRVPGHAAKERIPSQAQIG